MKGLIGPNGKRVRKKEVGMSSEEKALLENLLLDTDAAIRAGEILSWELPTDTSAKPAKSSLEVPAVSEHEQIALLAYFYWEARERTNGSAEEDWFRAEREIMCHPKKSVSYSS